METSRPLKSKARSPRHFLPRMGTQHSQGGGYYCDPFPRATIATQSLRKGVPQQSFFSCKCLQETQKENINLIMTFFPEVGLEPRHAGGQSVMREKGVLLMRPLLFLQYAGSAATRSITKGNPFEIRALRPECCNAAWQGGGLLSRPLD